MAAVPAILDRVRDGVFKKVLGSVIHVITLYVACIKKKASNIVWINFSINTYKKRK